MAILQNTTVSGSLVVTGDLTARQFILSSSVSYFTESFASGSTRFGDSADDVMRVTGSLMMSSSAGLSLYVTGSNGYVGIGTSLPSESLEINGNAFIGYGHTYGFRIGIGDHLPNGNVFGSILWGVASVYGGSNGDAIYIPRQGNNCGHRFYTGNTTPTEKMTIAHTGLVGIGTTNPSNKLHVESASGDGPYLTTFQTTSGAADTGPSIFFGLHDGSTVRDAGNIRTLKENGTAGNYATYMSFATRTNGSAAAEKMRILSGGQVNINGSAANTQIKLAVLQTENNHVSQFYVNNGSSNAAVYARVDDTQNVFAFFDKSGVVVGSISTNGTTTAYNTTSDYRLKEDFKQINGLDKLSAIKVYDFKWKGTEDRIDGVIAHELQEVMPYAVYGEKDAMNEDGSIKPQGVDYSKLVPVLVKSIQELSAKVTALENK